LKNIGRQLNVSPADCEVFLLQICECPESHSVQTSLRSGAVRPGNDFWWTRLSARSRASDLQMNKICTLLYIKSNLNFLRG